MKIIKIKAAVKINLGKGEKGTMNVILEIPYAESVFKESSLSHEETLEWLEGAKEVLQKRGINVNQIEEAFIKTEEQVYGPVVKQIAYYLAATLTDSLSGMEILSLLQIRLEETRKEAIEIMERNTKNTEKNR